ncbi:MAG: hypothetical protein AB7K71_38170 [Polyangiaceae bacterium]
MTDHSNDAPVNSERRWLGAALLGALGTSVLSGCANQLGESEPQLGTATAEVTANVVAYNDLRALVPSPGGDEVVAVQGRVDRADGGEGLFVWADQDVSSDNDGTILKPTSKAASSPGRWRRVFSGAVNVRWFGAVSDTEAESGSVAMDSTAAVVAAIKASAPYGRTYFPRGVYWVDADALTAANYVLHGGARLIGENHSSAPLSVIKARTPGICLLEATVRLMVESLTIDCAGAVDQGIRLLTAHSSSLRHVVVKNAKKNGIFSGNASPPPPQGWTSGESAGLHFEKVVVTTCGEAGIKLLGASDSMLLGCIVTWNGGPGLEIHGSASTVEQVRQSGGIIWIGGEVSLNGFTGYKTPPTPGTMNFPQIVIRGVEWARLESIYMEAGEQPAVRIQDSSRGVTLTGLRVGGAGTANRAFHLLGVQACTVFDCHAQGGDYYPAVRIEDAGSSIAHGNTVINAQR